MVLNRVADFMSSDADGGNGRFAVHRFREKQLFLRGMVMIGHAAGNTLNTDIINAVRLQ